MKQCWAGGFVVLALLALPASSAVAQGQQSSRDNRTGSELKQNYPNPFNPDTRIAFSVGGYPNCIDPSRQYRVSLRIFNVLAQQVAVPVLQGGNVRRAASRECVPDVRGVHGILGWQGPRFRPRGLVRHLFVSSQGERFADHPQNDGPQIGSTHQNIEAASQQGAAFFHGGDEGPGLFDRPPDLRGARRVSGQANRGRLQLRGRHAKRLQDRIGWRARLALSTIAHGQLSQRDHRPHVGRVAHVGEDRVAIAGAGQEDESDDQSRRLVFTARAGDWGLGDG